MKFYWRIRSLPELDHLTGEQRSALLKRCVGWWFMCRQVIFCLLIGIAVTGCLGSQLHIAIAAPIGLLIVMAAYQFDIHRTRVDIQMQIIEMYRGQQLPICLNCGYDLRSIEVSQCPECGAAVRAKLKQ